MDDGVPEGLWQRTVRRLGRAWQDVSTSVLGNGGDDFHPDLPEPDALRAKLRMQACLEGHGGEVSARARAAALGRGYLSLSPLGRARFLRILATEFDTDSPSVMQAIAELDDLDDWSGRKRAERRLRKALEPPRRRLLTQFNALPEGVKFLVDMRAELLAAAADDPALGELERDLKDLLGSWFDVGFLELRRITWDSPASILEKLIAYEAVHEIQSWDDLKNRLDSDRRLYGFFHPRMPDEPLIFVEVALTDGIAGNIQELLDESLPATDPHEADTAIFYSISNAQQGLAGISFGGFLIKRVVDQLTAEFDGLRTFSTLSPIPGFTKWLYRQFDKLDEADILTPAERRSLAQHVTDGDAEQPLRSLLSQPGWHHRTPEIAEALEKPLLRLCAHYLAEEKRSDGRALDPVAHFHLSNGARMERLNWLADTSEKGLRQSAGLMINYRYVVADIPENHEAYSGEGRIPAAPAVRGLLK